MGWLYICGLILAVINIIGLCWFVVHITIDSDFEYMYSPNWLYDNTYMNKLGCWFIASLLAILIPFAALPMLIHYLFHLGR